MMATICEWLKQRAAGAPAVAYTFVDANGGRHPISYGELGAAACGLAAYLQDAVVPSGPVLLVYPAGLDFVKAFWGCLLAGRIAVPIPAPGKDGGRLAAITADSGARAVLTTPALMPRVEAALRAAGFAEVRVVDSTGVEENVSPFRCEPIIHSTDVAYLQYTSGSTSTPRGVMVSHANLLANLADIDEAFEHVPGDVLVSWLPHFHDMGLVYGVIQPVFGGTTAFLLSPRAFIQRPLHWLETLSKVGATHSGGPNFAYDLCARRISPEQCRGLDLSRWRVAFNGAEPVRRESLRRFAAAFQHCGFREESFHPAYGLAEATLKVSCRTKNDPLVSPAPDENTMAGQVAALVGCGRPGSRTRVRIVDPHTLTPCTEGDPGEIWVAGEGVALGYWRKPEESSDTFCARLSDEQGTFLRTGDLGLIYQEVLYPAGRIKDLIIIRGANYYPQDIESTVEAAHASIRSGCVAAFAVEREGCEELAVIAEVAHPHSEKWSGAAEAIRAEISGQHGITAYAVVLIEPGGIPKTSSGKIQRYLCRARFLEGAFAVVDQLITTGVEDGLAAEDGAVLRTRLDQASSPEEKNAVLGSYLTGIAARLAGADPAELDTARTLVSLGLDSMRAAEIEASLETALGGSGIATMLLSEVSIRDLAPRLLALVASRSSLRPAGTGVPAPEEGETCAPASVEQERLYWLHQQASSAYNLVGSIRLSGLLRVDLLQRALTEVVRRHQILRVHFELRDRVLMQIIAPPEPAMIGSFDLTAYAEPSRKLATMIQEQAGIPFDLDRGPCYRTVLLRTGREEHTLLLILHHAIVDARSIALIFEEAVALYQAYLADAAPAPPEPSLQFPQFARWERQHLNDSCIDEHLAYWVKSLSRNLIPAAPKRVQRAAMRASAAHFLALAAPVTRELRKFAQSQDATLFMVLLAAFVAAMAEELKQPRVVIGIPVPGRPHPEAPKAIGPFSYPLPFAVDLSGHLEFHGLVALIRTQWLEAFAHQDVPFSRITRALKGEGSAVFRSLLTLLPPMGDAQRAGDLAFSPVTLEPSALDLDLYAAVKESGDQLDLTFAYDRDWERAGSVERLAARFAAILESAKENPALDIARAASLSNEDGTREEKIVLASTFTAEPVAEALAFWMDELEIAATVQTAPYNQIFQQLLDPASALCMNENGANVLLVRLQDWMERGTSPAQALEDARRLVAGIKAASRSGGVPFLLLLCPASPGFLAGEERSELEATLEAHIVGELAEESAVHVVTSTALLQGFESSRYNDEEAAALGRMPYSQEFMATIATAIARKLHAIRRLPYKVVVLDCDNTLWTGVCGEDGPTGITLDASRNFLQEFILSAHKAGMLLCLCSKNNLDDVVAAFTLNPGMPLQWHHFVANRIGWEAKSEGIRSLSRELGLGLDSFIFMDDSPLECAEVRAACPEVVTLLLPSLPEQIPGYLKNLWVFDLARVTDEDRRRPEYYRQEQERSREREQAASLEDFLNSLELEVSIGPVHPGSEARVSQLTRRTNQFNLNGVPYSEAEVSALSRSPQWICLAVEARDRFGDYGLVGAVMCETAEREFCVRGLWMSCRALGRGIESRLVAELAQAASLRGYHCLRFCFADTSRNAPIRLFLDQLVREAKNQSSNPDLFCAPFEIAAGCTARPFDRSVRIRTEKSAASDSVVNSGGWQLFERIATRWSDIEAIIESIRSRRSIAAGSAGAPEEAHNEIESALAAIWQDSLGLEHVGRHDDFFALGGHSVLAVQLLAEINRKFAIQLPMDVFFESEFTIADVALIIERAFADAEGATAGTL